jgi:hypothetical protein
MEDLCNIAGKIKARRKKRPPPKGGKRRRQNTKPDWRKYLYNHAIPGGLQMFLTGFKKAVMLKR